ncbi:MAG TPA: hypothetical protein VE545_03430 [Candidatus Dormibacteraeota bacterium]|nr:hypothetical protein [Candidatus Dormibacteraeota bacterium]
MNIFGTHASVLRGKSRAALFAACSGVLAATIFLLPIQTRADEIHLKDGKVLYGEFVGLDGNLYKVKTDYGYVLVEKDKIASIVPVSSNGADAKPTTVPTIKKESAKRAPAAKPEPAPADASPAGDRSADSAAESSPSPAELRRQKAAALVANSAVKPEVRAAPPKKVVAPSLQPVASSGAPASVVTSSAVPVPPPKEVEPTPEEIRGNLYINYANNFRIYKAPSWNLIEDARQTLPNAIVAMGTFNESTLLVVGKEKSKEALDPAAAAVEHRVREVYENYRQISRRTTIVGGLPGVEFRYRGMADDHDWSGTLVVLSRGNEIFTILGMTYADTDLIQIQENVIARSIASLNFSPIAPAAAH